MDYAVGIDAAELLVRLRHPSKAAHFRILTVVSYFKPVLTFTRPSLHRSTLKNESPLSSTIHSLDRKRSHSTSHVPAVPTEVELVAVNGDCEVFRTLTASSPDFAGLAHLG